MENRNQFRIVVQKTIVDFIKVYSYVHVMCLATWFMQQYGKKTLYLFHMESAPSKFEYTLMSRFEDYTQMKTYISALFLRTL